MPKKLKLDINFSPQPPRYIWNPRSSPNEFRSFQSEANHIQNCNSVCSRLRNSEEDVKSINSDLINILTNIAHSSLELKGSPLNNNGRRKSRKNAWFDPECIRSRISLRKACKNYCKSPTNETIIKISYQMREEHKKLIKRKKHDFFNSLNREIEEHKNIKWENFKKLKAQHSNSKRGDDMDLQDLANFYKFFKDLYSEQTLQAETVNRLKNETEDILQEPVEKEVDQILNDNITSAEIDKAIMKLKRGKASAEDAISNEFLIHSTSITRSVILKVFNECLKHGVYPWNTALITPLHKKGCKGDPNNYRAIAVGSNLGKLFSGILLERLMTFRTSFCPDTVNQLGFVKEAQTSDHIFTLRTCIEKYTKKKKRLYACFVDYRKAFDTVCREALLYKLCKLGVKGNFFTCIQYMYENSSAKLKLLNKISEAIDILIGTEQGHPMSPELFKIYLVDLSKHLNDTFGLEVPTLNEITVSHLLWADDLVLVALDTHSLQVLIDRVHYFCEEWGLSVNISKTAIMVFNRSGRQLQESHGFQYGSTHIPSARTYCYLGIVFNLNGSSTTATDELRKKGLKAYFALKSLIQLDALSVRSVFKLFDALILPVVAYGCQTWLHETNFVKAVTKDNDGKAVLQKLATDPLEKLHLRFLKWTLQVHKKSSNIACYGDSGRYPLVIKLAKQVVSYYNRLDNFDAAGVQSLARHAFVEQRTNNYSWHNNINKIMQIAGHSCQDGLACPTRIRSNLESHFNTLWDNQRKGSSKLTYYNQVKKSSSIIYEDFLDLADSRDRQCLMRLRSSSHRLNCETARYVTQKEIAKSNSTVSWFKRCEFCTTEEVHLLAHLPFANIIEEDEHHVLITCPRYHAHRTNLQESTKSLLLRNEEHHELYTWQNVTKFGRYVKKIFGVRFSKKEKRRQKSSTLLQEPTNQPSPLLDRNTNTKQKLRVSTLRFLGMRMFYSVLLENFSIGFILFWCA